MSYLKSCSRCGKSGLVNLRLHSLRCKGKSLAPAKRVAVEVEVLGPRDEKALNEYAAEIARIHGVIEGKTRQFQENVIYDFVEMGLYFVKAKEKIGHGDFLDFVKLETVSNLGISDRTARNYMNAARNAGLTARSTSDDVVRLRQSKALHGKKPTELYRLMDVEPVEEQEPEKKADLLKDAAISLRESCENVATLRDRMSKRVYGTICARLHRTLEELTGCGWEMSRKKRAGENPLFREHGDVYELGN